MIAFNGKWMFRSFCPRSGNATMAPEIIAPWTPPGVLTVATGESGAVTGTLNFGTGVILQITGSVTPASAERRLTEGIELTGEGGGAIYKVRGYAVEGTGDIVGSVVSIQNDLAKQPVGTSGPFLLFRSK